MPIRFLHRSGRQTRTADLWVMSPTSYHCSIPRYNQLRIDGIPHLRFCDCKVNANTPIIQTKFKNFSKAQENSHWNAPTHAQMGHKQRQNDLLQATYCRSDNLPVTEKE